VLLHSEDAIYAPDPVAPAVDLDEGRIEFARSGAVILSSRGESR
jgi:hypothetical protein